MFRKFWILALAFLIPVAWAASVTFTWTNPTERTDGSVLNNLAGIQILCATTSGGPYTLKATLAPDQNAGAVVDQFATGTTHYCVARAVDADGLMSANTSEISKAIPNAPPNPPSGFSFRP